MGEAEAAAPPAEAPEYKLSWIGEDPVKTEQDVNTVDKVVLVADKEYVVDRAAAELIPFFKAVLAKYDEKKGAADPEGEGGKKHLGQVTKIPFPKVNIAAEGEDKNLVPVVKDDVAAVIIEYVERLVLNGYPDEEKVPRIQKPLRGKIEDVCPEWALDFVYSKLVDKEDEKKHGPLFDIMHGAHALQVEPLEALCGLTASSIVKGKDPSQLRDLFGLPSDWQEGEEESISEKTAWAQD